MSSPASSDPSPDQPKRGRVLLARLLFLVFLVVGSGILYIATIRPLQNVLVARSWLETPCVINSSRVVKVGGAKHGTQSYRAEIFYAYTIGNTHYTTSNYQFDSGGSDGKEAKQQIVDQYPPGRQTVCYINPTNPGQAVLNRKPNGEMFYGLIGLLFALFGLVGFVSSFRLKSVPPAV
ncbi:DUF3592 domain-containing protein [Chthoniobacter flavus]|uniref:DUF3592 domain-containing protein n=1 Tax=Chthoniobacter flavus TaxID=191863 RepID=UPI0002E39EF3|nr:DUF3592 domain-containing protein [Chthoniobacter flavus]